MNIEKLRTVLHPLDDDTIHKYFIEEKIKKGSYFLKEGQICRKIAFLNKGMIRHYYDTTEGDITRWVSLENNFSVSLTSFIKQEKSNEHLEALEDCEMLTISRANWEQLYNKNEDFKELWVHRIEASYIALDERVFNLIAKKAEDRFDYMMEKYPAFIERVPAQYLASMLGTTPRHLNRIRKAKSQK